MEPTSAPDQDPVTQELVSAPVGDRCTNCQTPLAPDQRYCVNCGERRGKARYSFDALAGKPAAAPPPERPRHRPHLSSGFSFIAGVATLLLAVGVGVLIGHNSDNTSKVAQTPSQQVIKIEGNNGTGGSTGGSQAASKGSNTFKAPKVKLTPKVVKKVDQAASKVLGSGSKNLSNNPTQQVGGSCSGGAGCNGTTHKFDGNYFGQ